MTEDEILTAYEDAWRQSALEGRQQFFGIVCGGVGPAEIIGDPDKPFGDCAVLTPLVQPICRSQATAFLRSWVCACGWSGTSLSSAILHMNNAHRWSWDRLAGKFREAWREGLERAKPVRPDR